jgi:GNAT superfamily N-acetyltransferase
MPTHEILHAKSDAEIESCWEVVTALRPHLIKAYFVEQVRRMMQGGYQMIYIMEHQLPVAFAGFREMEMLFSGKIIYIDDLSTLSEYRGKGYGGSLLDYIHTLAKKDGRAAVHLDSGHHRSGAHRLYLNKGYTISSHHFSKEIK